MVLAVEEIRAKAEQEVQKYVADANVVERNVAYLRGFAANVLKGATHE